MSVVYTDPKYLIITIVVNGQNQEVAIVFSSSLGYDEYAYALGLQSDQIMAAGQCEISRSTVNDELLITAYSDDLVPESFGPGRKSRLQDADIIFRTLT